MIRFLNLKGQIIEGEPSFAFYDTVRGEVIQFNGMQVFDSIENFKSYYDNEFPNGDDNFSFERFTGLVPDDYFSEAEGYHNYKTKCRQCGNISKQYVNAKHTTRLQIMEKWASNYAEIECENCNEKTVADIVSCEFTE